jgi:hypothetical protein
MTSGHHDLPPPNTAPYRDLPSFVSENPKIALASRCKERAPEKTPGSTYIPPALDSDAQKSSLSYRHAEGRDSGLDNPGPSADSITSKFANEANKYTLY